MEEQSCCRRYVRDLARYVPEPCQPWERVGSGKRWSDLIQSGPESNLGRLFPGLDHRPVTKRVLFLGHYRTCGTSQFSVTTPGYFAKSLTLLVTTVTVREAAWAAINLSRWSCLLSRVACRIGP